MDSGELKIHLTPLRQVHFAQEGLVAPVARWSPLTDYR
jgi:hypothetical protein